MVSRKTLALLIIIPIAYTMMFGGLFSRNVLMEVPIVICNLDDGFKSQQLIQDIYNTPELKVVAIETNAEDISKIMIANDSFGAVVIPKDYSKNLNIGGSTSIEVVIDNTNRSIGGTVSKAIQSVLTPQNINFTLSSRVLYNPTGGYIDFFLAALIMHSTQIAIVFAIAPMIVSINRELDITLILKLWAMCSIIETAIISICLSIGIVFFDMLCRGSFVEIVILNSAFIICMIAFAICVGVLVNEVYKALLTPLVYIMPSIMFANVTWPRHSMDNFSLILSYIMPIGYAADDLRSLLIKGTAIDLTPHVMTLLLMTAVFITIAMIGVKHNAAKCSTRISTID